MEKDFEHLYPDKAEKLMSEWPALSSKLVAIAKSRTKKSAKLNKVLQDLEEEVIDPGELIITC